MDKKYLGTLDDWISVAGQTQYTNAVYLLTNTVNGKFYVGTAINLKQRLQLHASNIRRYSTIEHAIHKYGTESFTVHLLACDLRADERGDVEAAFIRQYDCVGRPNGYNTVRRGNRYED